MGACGCLCSLSTSAFGMSAAMKDPFRLASNASGSSRKFTTAKTLDTVLSTTSIPPDRREIEYFKLTESRVMIGPRGVFKVLPCGMSEDDCENL